MMLSGRMHLLQGKRRPIAFQMITHGKFKFGELHILAKALYIAVMLGVIATVVWALASIISGGA